MFLFKKVNRTILKAISYRCLGSAQTIIISFYITGSLPRAMAISGLEVVSKIVFFYIHEQIWERK